MVLQFIGYSKTCDQAVVRPHSHSHRRFARSTRSQRLEASQVSACLLHWLYWNARKPFRGRRCVLGRALKGLGRALKGLNCSKSPDTNHRFGRFGELFFVPISPVKNTFFKPALITPPAPHEKQWSRRAAYRACSWSTTGNECSWSRSPNTGCLEY